MFLGVRNLGAAQLDIWPRVLGRWLSDSHCGGHHFKDFFIPMSDVWLGNHELLGAGTVGAFFAFSIPMVSVMSSFQPGGFKLPSLL
jgi:hypothetical protein